MKGTSESSFDANTNITRAMIVTILHRLSGDKLESLESSFTDIEADSWYTDGVKWANKNNIVLGMGNGEFKPSQNLSREQLVTIMYRYAKHKGYKLSKSDKLDKYTDYKEVSDYAQEAMSWAVESGIISGTSDTTLAPKEGATRAQMAVIFKRFIEKY